jgi:hypothetical protein
MPEGHRARIFFPKSAPQRRPRHHNQHRHTPAAAAKMTRSSNRPPPNRAANQDQNAPRPHPEITFPGPKGPGRGPNLGGKVAQP